MECEVCGETIETDSMGCFIGDVGEFYNPLDQNPERKNLIAHADCGLGSGMEIA